jgi:hypothetical protein
VSDFSRGVGVGVAAVVIVVGAVGLARSGVISGHDDNDCAALAFTHNGIPWKATKVERTELSCDEATAVIRAYAKPRNCQFQPSCQIGTYRCRTLVTEGSTFTERCTRGHRSVQWRGTYVSS